MWTIRLFGIIGGLAAVVAPPWPVGTAIAAPGQAEKQRSRPFALPPFSRPPLATRGSAPPLVPNPRLVCTARLLRADPGIDPGITTSVERPVDSKMVIPSVCGK
jgi:hypothetical protein